MVEGRLFIRLLRTGLVVSYLPLNSGGLNNPYDLPRPTR